MKIFKITILLVVFNFLYSCSTTSPKSKEEFIEEQLNFANAQTSLLLNDAIAANRIPRTIDENGEMHFTDLQFDWTKAFSQELAGIYMKLQKIKNGKMQLKNFKHNMKIINT